jgi:hypothetical protein
MTNTSSLTTVTLALHLATNQIEHALSWINIDPTQVARREIDWRHFRRSNEIVTLVFGPTALRRVWVRNLVPELLSHNFLCASCEIVYKQAKYTKTEVRSRSLKRGRFREGEAKFENGKPKLKEYIKIRFDRVRPTDQSQTPHLLISFLQDLVWKRGRVFLINRKNGSQGALVELVQLTEQRSESGGLKEGTEISFDPTRGFEARYVYLL